MKAIALVVVKDGYAYVYKPLHVDARIVDLDLFDIPSTTLPRDIGFEALVEEAKLVEGKDFAWE